jgi:hypothetical protein
MAREQSRSQSQAAATQSSSPARSNSAPVDLSAFSLETFSVEIRYATALLLWDRAGVLWRSIQEKYPDIRVVTVEPSKTSFQSGKTAFVIEVKTARINAVDPEKSSMDELPKVARDFFKLTIQHLEISLCERLGLRLVYFKEFKDREQAASAFHAMGLVKVPDGKRFDVDEHPVNQQYVLRWESEKKGAVVQCRAETRKIDWDPPIESVRLWYPVHREQNGIVVDIDYYTVAPVEVGQLDMGEWSKHALHVISRDIRYLFEE